MLIYTSPLDHSMIHDIAYFYQIIVSRLVF